MFNGTLLTVEMSSAGIKLGVKGRPSVSVAQMWQSVRTVSKRPWVWSQPGGDVFLLCDVGMTFSGSSGFTARTTSIKSACLVGASVVPSRFRDESN